MSELTKAQMGEDGPAPCMAGHFEFDADCPNCVYEAAMGDEVEPEGDAKESAMSKFTKRAAAEALADVEVSVVMNVQRRQYWVNRYMEMRADELAQRVVDRAERYTGNDTRPAMYRPSVEALDALVAVALLALDRQAA